MWEWGESLRTRGQSVVAGLRDDRQEFSPRGIRAHVQSPPALDTADCVTNRILQK